MTDKDAIRILKEERDHCAVHLNDKGKTEEYYQEMMGLVKAYDLALNAHSEKKHCKWTSYKQIVDGVEYEAFNKVCSECGHSTKYKFPYCPWCGAKMIDERGVK